MSPPEHFDDGQKKERFVVSVPTPLSQEVENESTTSKMLNESLELKTATCSPLKPQSAMPESVPVIKKKTSNAKSPHSNSSSPKPESSKTLDQGLTGIDLDLNPFWSSYTQELSNRLWLPGKTDCVALDSNSLNGSSKKQMLNSWFSVELMNKKTPLESSQTTYLQSLLSSLPNTTAYDQRTTENNEKPPAEKAKCIRVYPTIEQRETLNKWFGARRWIYNKCLQCIREGTKPSLKVLREKVINNKNFEKENRWMLDYDYDLRDEALRDLLKNFKSNRAKGKSFQLHFLTKKNSQTLSVLGKKWNKKNNFYSSVFKPSILHSAEPLPDQLMYSSRLVRTPLKKYYLCLPQPLEASDNQAHHTSKAIFIDPGVKAFATGYDPEGKIIVWGGQRNVGKIARLLHYRKKLRSQMAHSTAAKRKRLRLADLRIGEKIFNLVDDLHKKLCKWLCENYSHIYIPKLNFHKCKKLDKNSKSKLASLRHCAFVDRLVDKTREYKNCRVFVVGEAYTSKTCGNCGWQHPSLGNKDTFQCGSCHVQLGRDVNGSRNIMLRYFSIRAEASVITSQSVEA